MTDRVSPDPADAPAAIHGCVEAVERCRTLVTLLEREPGAYASFGPHLRHCLDHFRCLLRGQEAGSVDYDARDRDPAIETDPARFRGAASRLLDDLAALDPSTLERPLQVLLAVSPDGRQASCASTLRRELAFASGHTIHHLAIMTVLASERGIPVPEDLGVAYSTAAYRRSKAETELSP